MCCAPIKNHGLQPKQSPQNVGPNGNFFAWRIFLRSYHVLQYFLACRSLAGAGCSHTNRCGFVVGATGRMKHGQLTEQEDSEDAARDSVTPVASWKRCTSWEPIGPARVRTGQTGREMFIQRLPEKLTRLKVSRRKSCPGKALPEHELWDGMLHEKTHQ